jgi:hypothetical protein
LIPEKGIPENQKKSNCHITVFLIATSVVEYQWLGLNVEICLSFDADEGFV